MHHSICDSCEKLKKDLNEALTKNDQFQSLSKSVIQTDFLFRKLAEVEQEYQKIKNDLKSNQEETDSLEQNLKNVTRENDTLKRKSKEHNFELTETQKKLEDALNKLKQSSKNEHDLNELLKLKEKSSTDLEQKNKELNNKVLSIQQNLDNALQKLSLSNKNENDLKREIEQLKSNEAQNISLRFEFNTETGEKAKSADAKQYQQNPQLVVASTRNDSVKKRSASPQVSFFLGEEENSIDREDSNDKKTANLEKSEPTSFSEVDKASSKTMNSRSSSSSSISSLLSDSSSASSSLSNSSTSSSSKSASTPIQSPKASQILKSSTQENLTDRELLGFSMSEDEDDLIDLEKNEKDQSNITIDKIEVEHEDEDALIDTSDLRKEVEMNSQQNEIHLVPEKIDEFSKNIYRDIQSQFLDELFSQAIDQSVNEHFILQFIIDKLFNEEISEKSVHMRGMCRSVLEEEKTEQKKREKLIQQEIKLKLEGELIERSINDTVDTLIHECCERVLVEAKNEFLNLIYQDLVEEVITKSMIEKYFLENIFDEMTSIQKPFLEKILPPVVEEDKPKKAIETTTSGVKRRLTQIIDEPAPKIIPGFANKTTLFAPSKKPKIDLADNLRDTVDSVNSQLDSSSNICEISQPSLSAMNEIEEYFKECLAEYFRRYNFKVGFTFDELDELIDKLVMNVYKRREKNIDSKFCCAFISRMLLKHYINNRFIPLDPIKLKQADEAELLLFKQVQGLKNNVKHQAIQQANTSPGLLNFSNKFGNRANTSESYLNFMQNKLDTGLNIKITNEEDKYVYLIKKLREYAKFENVVEEFLNCLKIMLLSNDLNDFYSFKIRRMICFICKATKNHQFLKSLIYDMLIINFTSMSIRYPFQSFVILFVRIWPEFLNWPSYSFDVSCSFDEVDSFEVAIKKNPILCVIIFIVKRAITESKQDKKDELSQKSYDSIISYFNYILETLCNWAVDFNDSDEIWSFFKSNLSIENNLFGNENVFTVNDNEIKPNQLAFEYLEAIKLLCASSDEVWTLDKFLKVDLKQEIDAASKKLNNTSQMREKEMFAFYLLAFSNVLACSLKKSTANQTAMSISVDFVKSILKILNTLNSVEIDLSVIESCLMLAPLKLSGECFSAIKAELVSLKSTKRLQLPNSTQFKIDYTFSSFKEAL